MNGGAAAPPPKHLLDVNVLLAAIWSNHPQHAKAFAWLSGKTVLVCPLALVQMCVQRACPNHCRDLQPRRLGGV
jgi:hypothetical protein